MHFSGAEALTIIARFSYMEAVANDHKALVLELFVTVSAVGPLPKGQRVWLLGGLCANPLQHFKWWVLWIESARSEIMDLDKLCQVSRRESRKTTKKKGNLTLKKGKLLRKGIFLSPIVSCKHL